MILKKFLSWTIFLILIAGTLLFSYSIYFIVMNDNANRAVMAFLTAATVFTLLVILSNRLTKWLSDKIFPKG